MKGDLPAAVHPAVQVEGRKRYEFLEAVVSAMDAHVRFFERGSAMLANLGPYIAHSLEVGGDGWAGRGGMVL